MGSDYVFASTGGMEPELAHKTLESQFRVSLLTANDAFFIIEDLCVKIVISVNVARDESKLQSLLQNDTEVPLDSFERVSNFPGSAKFDPGAIGIVTKIIQWVSKTQDNGELRLIHKYAGKHVAQVRGKIYLAQISSTDRQQFTSNNSDSTFIFRNINSQQITNNDSNSTFSSAQLTVFPALQTKLKSRSNRSTTLLNTARRLTTYQLAQRIELQRKIPKTCALQGEPSRSKRSKSINIHLLRDPSALLI
ncbi:hypothetical protein AVEN_209684-1 [Araneus ventricosus]|uniref:Uncharacterized protein n=1 Tax=Araneus ventricosus TaxID=182803 RepID=A0A4Y2P3T9_ARAVE|nr:hypothetical protein AVEN_209684-1 [Araneus ventricosus]